MAQQIGPGDSPGGSAPKMLVEGDRFGGSNGRRFLVEGRAGAGGQAMVFRVRDTRLDRLVAAKVSTAHETRQQQLFLERFERELQLSSRVSHPHVLQVYDCGELEGGAPYVLLEWMDRGDLVGFIDRARKSGRNLPYPFVRYYGLSLAAALRAVHGAQMVHRDVKPDNMLIAADGVAKLTDFGIAKDISPDAIRLTEMGQTMGTLGFMAPEQLAGLPGPQSDIFSFGVTFYVMLVGRIPPQKQLNAIPVGRILPEAWEGLSPSVVEFIQRATASELEDRFQSFDECLDQLNKVSFGPDNRGLLLPGELPPLPSGAFITATNTSVEGPIPMAFDTELARRQSDSEDGLGDTMDLTTVAPEQQARASNPDLPAEGVGVRTGFETRIGEELSGGPVRPTDGVREIAPEDQRGQVEPVGHTRAFTTQDAEAVAVSDTGTLPSSTQQDLAAARGGNSKGLLVGAVAAVAVVAVGVFVALSGGATPTDSDTLQALQQYEKAAAQGSWSNAEAAVAKLPAAAAELDSGKLLVALDELLAGNYQAARDKSSGLLELAGEPGARAALVHGAATRLSSAQGYGDALNSYLRVLNCGDAGCAELKARAQRAVAEVCTVLDPGTEGCAGVTRPEPRQASLLASLVLVEDGHLARGQEVLARALEEGPPDGGCVENSVLSRWAAEPALGAALRMRVVTAGATSPRSSEQCVLFAESE